MPFLPGLVAVEVKPRALLTELPSAIVFIFFVCLFLKRGLDRGGDNMPLIPAFREVQDQPGL